MINCKLIRDVSPIAAATGVIGISFGAIAVTAGISPWLAMAMSLLVSSGGAQFMAIGVVVAGGGAVAAVLAGLVLNIRHLPYGLAVGDLLGARWWTRLLGSHLMFDEAVAFTLANRATGRAKPAYWTAGVMLYLCWNLGSLLGVLVGTAIADPKTFGLDAAFPAVMLALMLPSLRDTEARWVAGLGAIITLVAAPFLPPGIPVLLSLLGLLVAILPVPRRKETKRVNDECRDLSRQETT